MKLAIISILVGIVVPSYAQVQHLQVGNKIINLSSYCRTGSVTAFIFSTYGCSPCEKLKSELENRYNNNEYLLLYECYMGTQEDLHNWNQFKNAPVPKYWSKVERISEFPTLYIYSPLGNLLYKYVGIDNKKLEKIFNNIDFLLSNISYFDEAKNENNNNNLKETYKANYLFDGDSTTKKITK